MKTVLVTGAAGFIGYHTCARLLQEGYNVVGLDNLNSYYSVGLKQDRINLLCGNPTFSFHKLDLADSSGINKLFTEIKLESVVHLGAQAGVRYSLDHPDIYVQSNIVGFLNILEVCRHHKVEHLVYASSSSVYGSNTKMPFSVTDNVDHPISLYAATKKSNELMAHTYSHLFGLPTTGLRFFTVYGPWGRPDMAAFLFTESILNDKPINIFNEGKMLRDFTYVDDIVDGVVRVLTKPPKIGDQNPLESEGRTTTTAPYKLYNIGNNEPVELAKFITVLEDCIGKKAIKNLLPMQPGDVPATFADIDDLRRDTGFEPKTTLEEGLSHFVNWYREYYRVSVS